MTPRSRAGLVQFKPVGKGSRVAPIAPASPFDRLEFEAGLTELRRLGLEPVYDDSVFDAGPIVAGPAARRAEALTRAVTRDDVDAVMAIRGGYGSAEMLPWLDAAVFRRRRLALIGYSDVTALHAFLNCHARLTSVHGAMIDGRLSKGPTAYDPDSWLASMSATPLGEMAPEALEIINAGTVEGPLFGGTLTQIAASLGTPYEFLAPPGHVLFLDEVNERPYRLQRLLTQLRQSGRLEHASAVVFGQLPNCDEPGGRVTARAVIAESLAAFRGPVLFGFPSGHTTTPSLSMPLGVHVRVVGAGRPRLVFQEAAAA
jgi:muramoyltetrapeptide carboxypeptidase